MTQKGFENYFNNKINWKSFNYISDVITKYVDEGINMVLLVVVPDSDDEYNYVYILDNNNEGKFIDWQDNDTRRSNIVSDSKKYGIAYSIEIVEFYSDVKKYKEIFHKLHDRFINKFTVKIGLHYLLME